MVSKDSCKVSSLSTLTGEYLQCGRCFLLQLLAEIVGEEEVMDVSLIAKDILTMGANGGIEVVL